MRKFATLNRAHDLYPSALFSTTYDKFTYADHWYSPFAVLRLDFYTHDMWRFVFLPKL